MLIQLFTEIYKYCLTWEGLCSLQQEYGSMVKIELLWFKLMSWSYNLNKNNNNLKNSNF